MSVNDPQTITITPRFTGPDGMANGGFVAGLCAERVGGDAKVRLHAPTPLDKALRLDGAKLFDGETLLVEAEALGKPLDLDPIPHAPDAAELAAARAAFPDAEHHMAPNCFVCGIDRSPHEALHILSGASPERNVATGAWTPQGDLADESGAVAIRYIWAALDCPSYFGIGRTDRVALLAGMAARLFRRVAPGETLTVTGWPLDVDGRKYHAGSVIHDESGDMVAAARALWIDVGGVGEC